MERLVFARYSFRRKFGTGLREKCIGRKNNR